MADLLIKGVEMPINCLSCPLNSVRICRLLHRAIAIDGKHDDCPVVELPIHDRLIDADKLLIDIMDRGIDQVQFDDYSEFCSAIFDAPTVIDASEEA